MCSVYVFALCTEFSVCVQDAAIGDLNRVNHRLKLQLKRVGEEMRQMRTTLNAIRKQQAQPPPPTTPTPPAQPNQASIFANFSPSALPSPGYSNLMWQNQVLQMQMADDAIRRERERTQWAVLMSLGVFPGQMLPTTKKTDDP